METHFDEATPKVVLFLVQAQVLIALHGGKENLTEEDRRSLEELTVIDSLDEENCSVTYTTMGEQNTINFNNVQPDLIAWDRENNAVKYTLRGNNFSEDGRGDITFFSDSVTQQSAERAMGNLFDKYCNGLESEF